MPPSSSPMPPASAPSVPAPRSLWHASLHVYLVWVTYFSRWFSKIVILRRKIDDSSFEYHPESISQRQSLWQYLFQNDQHFNLCAVQNLMKASSLQRGLTCFQTNGNGIKLNCVQNIHPKLVSLFWGVYDASAPDTNFSPKIFRSQWQTGWKEQYFLALNSFSQLFKANHTAS